MTYPVSNQAYSISSGASKIGAPIFSPADPSNTDVAFPIQQRWVNTQTQAIWILETLAPSNGVVYAQWRALGPIVLKTVDPTTSDYLYPLGQVWGNTSSHRFWMLVNVSGTTATWDVTAGPTTADIATITGDSGGAVTGDASGNVNLVGASGQVIVTGNPGTNTLTISLTGGGGAIEQLKPNLGSNVVPSGGVVNVNDSVTTFTDGSIANTLKIELQGPLNQIFYGQGTDVAASTITTQNNGVLVTGNTGIPSLLAGPGTTGNVLQSNAASAPSFSTATYPSSTTINDILYSSSNNVVAQITTANNGVLITSAGGVPSISSTLPAAVQGNITSVGTISSGTWNGSVISGQYGGTGVANTGRTINLSGGVAGYVLTSDSSGNGSWALAEPSGLLFRQGTATLDNTGIAVTFSSPFPSNCFGVVITANSSVGGGIACAATSVNTNGFTGWNTFGGGTACFYLAYGN